MEDVGDGTEVVPAEEEGGGGSAREGGGCGRRNERGTMGGQAEAARVPWGLGARAERHEGRGAKILHSSMYFRESQTGDDII